MADAPAAGNAATACTCRAVAEAAGYGGRTAAHVPWRRDTWTAGHGEALLDAAAAAAADYDYVAVAAFAAAVFAAAAESDSLQLGVRTSAGGDCGDAAAGLPGLERPVPKAASPGTTSHRQHLPLVLLVGE